MIQLLLGYCLFLFRSTVGEAVGRVRKIREKKEKKQDDQLDEDDDDSKWQTVNRQRTGGQVLIVLGT